MTGEPPFCRKLEADDKIENFDCGVQAVNEWLLSRALPSQRSNGSVTHVFCSEDTVIGYYALAAGSVRPDEAPHRVKTGMGRYPIPMVLLARLGVDRDQQKRGIGRALLSDASRRVVAVANQIGVRALMVDAKGPDATRFYMSCNFKQSENPRRLYILMKDLRHNLELL